MRGFGDKVWKITKGSAEDIKSDFSDFYGKAVYYHADGTMTVEGSIELAPWNNSIKAFQRSCTMASPYITIGQNGKIWKSCQGKYYYDLSPQGILYSDDDVNYKPLITGLCEKGNSGIGDYGYQYEKTNTPIFIQDKIFLNGWALNWKTTSRTSSLFFSEDSKSWKEIGLLINAESVRYNKKTKKFYLYLDGIGLFQSKKNYDCSCQTSTQQPIDPCKTITKKFDYKVEVKPVAQPNHALCWSACAAMLYSWRENKQFSIPEALALIEKDVKIEDRKFLKRYHESIANNGLTGGLDYQELTIWDFYSSVVVDEPSEFFCGRMKLVAFDENKILELKKSDLPILAARYPSSRQTNNPECPPYDGLHVVIIYGIHGDGTPQCTTFDIISNT